MQRQHTLHTLVRSTFGSKLLLSVTDLSCNMLEKMIAVAQAVVEDRLTDDTILLYYLVDVVRDLFLCHSDLLEKRSIDKPGQLVLSFFFACLRLSRFSSDGNHAAVASAWIKLAPLQRLKLRRVVRSCWISVRNSTLLELAGV